MAVALPKIVFPSGGVDSFQFVYPPRLQPAKNYGAVRHDNIGFTGIRESVFERRDEFFYFTMEWVHNRGDIQAWDTFLQYALQGGPFDYYADATLPAFTTFLLEDNDWRPDYKQLSHYTFRLKFRKLVAHFEPQVFEDCGAVEAPGLFASCPLDQPTQIGVPFSTTIPVSGGTAPYSFVKTAGNFPSGLTLNGATGQIQGTPTEFGAFPYTVQITDSSFPPQTTTINCQFNVGVTPCPGFAAAIGVVINRSQIPSTESNYVHSMEITDPRLKLEANGGFVKNPNGFDVRPTLVAGDCSNLSYELEDGGYDGVNGKIVIHVVLPTANGLNASINSIYQLNFGNASLTTDGSTALTWAAFRGVTHLHRVDGSVHTRESTLLPQTGPNIWIGQNGPSITPAQIGNGGSFDGVNDCFVHSGGQWCPGTEDFSASAWVKTSVSSKQAIFDKHQGLSADLAMWDFDVLASGVLYAEVQGNGFSNLTTITGSTPVNDGNWHFVVFTRSGATLKLYVDAVLDATVVGGGTANITDAGGANCIGKGGVFLNSNFFNGQIDEFREGRNIAWSQDRITADYHCQKNVKNPSTFYALV